jgi:RimJ/RimL family protein N-acetyltransferase
MTGKQVYIRILEKSDILTTQKWLNDPVISDIMGYLPVLTLENQLSWFDSIKNDKSRFIFAICTKSENVHIGNVGLGNIDYVHRHCMFNIFITDSKDRSIGIGTEATRLALDFAFNRLNMNKVHLRTSDRFKEANKLYLKLGFKKEGVLREHYYTNGKYEDKILYSILKREYES